MHFSNIYRNRLILELTKAERETEDYGGTFGAVSKDCPYKICY